MSCFEGEPPPDWAVTFGFDLSAVVFLGRAALGARLTARGGFAARLMSFNFCLLVAIWPSLLSATASCAATGTSPAIRRGNKRGGGRRAMAPSGPPHTLLLTRKSSEFTSNFMALLQAAGSLGCSEDPQRRRAPILPGC